MVRRRRGRGVVLSMHAFDGVPADLAERAQSMRSTGAEVIKIAVAAERLTDTCTLMDLAGIPRLPTRTKWTDTCCSRWGRPAYRRAILAARLRNRWTYAGDGVAPGPDAGRAPAERIRVPPDQSRRRALRRRRQSHRALALARHAQRRLCRARIERGVCAAAGRRRRRLRRLRTVDRHARREHHGAVQGRDADQGDETDPSPGASAPSTRSSSATAAGSARTRMSKAFSRRLPGRMALKGTRAAVLGCGRSRPGSRGRAVSQGASVTICARRPDAAAEVARLSDANAGTWPPRSGQLGRPRQRDLVRQRRAGRRPDGRRGARRRDRVRPGLRRRPTRRSSSARAARAA